jgi:hypothetical protein
MYLIQCELKEGEYSRSGSGVVRNLGGFGRIDGVYLEEPDKVTQPTPD